LAFVATATARARLNFGSSMRARASWGPFSKRGRNLLVSDHRSEVGTHLRSRDLAIRLLREQNPRSNVSPCSLARNGHPHVTARHSVVMSFKEGISWRQLRSLGVRCAAR